MFRSTNLTHTAIPKIVSEVIGFIHSKGHTCCYYDSSKGKLDWCNIDECEDVKMRLDMEKRQKQQEEFARRLIENGHKCVYYMESYPVQVGWCGKEKCTFIEKESNIDPFL